MKEFDRQYIDELIDVLTQKTSAISRILEKNDIDDADISALGDQYVQRRKVLEKLNSLFDSEEGMKFVDENIEYFKEKIDPVLKEDKKNVDKLNERVKELGGRLKQMVKQKSLLIYTKDQK